MRPTEILSAFLGLRQFSMHPVMIGDAVLSRAAWILAMTGAKLFTSSAKNSTAMSSPPASRISFCIHFEVIWP